MIDFRTIQFITQNIADILAASMMIIALLAAVIYLIYMNKEK